MSKNDMVSVPRDLLERCVKPVCESEYWDELKRIAAQPAEQHQGEPVALPERRDPVGGTLAGGYSFVQAKKDRGWNACLDEIAKLGPLYTHADAGEVERMRAEIEEWNRIFDVQEGKIDTLRAKAAERDELLRKCLMAVREQHCDDGEADFDLPSPLLVEIEAALSASAEPVDLEEFALHNMPRLSVNAEGSIVAHTKRGDLKFVPSGESTEDANISLPTGLNTFAKIVDASAPDQLKGFVAEDLEAAKIDGGYPITIETTGDGFTTTTPEATVRYVGPFGCSISKREITCPPGAEVTVTVNAPMELKISCPSVERDERAEFEKRFPDLDHTLCSHPDWQDQYESAKAGDMWNGWQARAALERKP